MSKIEKIVIIFLILSALIGIVLSYCRKGIRTRAGTISPETAESLDVEGRIIRNRSTVNINAAGKERLAILRGIGPRLAQRIVDYRRENGRFDSIDDLMNVKGIGPKKLKSIRENVILDE